MSQKKIGILIGSLRKDSLNRKMAKAMAAMAPPSLRFEILEIGQLPFFDQDLEETPPAAWSEFRKRVADCDGFLFVTPEYNRSVPAVLKNALDVGSRPYGQSVWNGRPAAVVSVSIGAQGGFGANHHLRQVLTFLNMPTLQQPEAYIGNASTLFGEDGAIANDGTRGFIAGFLQAFEAWIGLHTAGGRA